jgi:hypothetical protein
MTRIFGACVLAFLLGSNSVGQDMLEFETTHLRISIDAAGHLCRLLDHQTQTDYFPAGRPAPLLALYRGETILSPSSMQHDPATSLITLSYENGSKATIKAKNRGDYVRFELTAVEPRNGVEAVGWGPYPTTINKLIGETICVVRDDEFAIGMQALNIATIEGTPVENVDDNAGGGSYIGPLPGQTLAVRGRGDHRTARVLVPKPTPSTRDEKHENDHPGVVPRDIDCPGRPGVGG